MFNKPIALEDARLDVRHLHPNKIACTALQEAGIRTLGDLWAIWSRPGGQQGRFSTYVELHIDEKLNELKFIGHSKRVDWDAYHKNREEIEWPLFFTSAALEHLSVEDQQTDIGSIVMCNRVDSLRRASLGTVGAVVAAARGGIEKLENIGPSSLDELWRGIQALSLNLDDSGRVKWDHLGQCLGQSLIPAKRASYGSISPFTLAVAHDALDELTEVWAERAEQTPDSVSILRSRLLHERPQTLEEAAAALPNPTSRERARQIESGMLEAIRRGIYHNDFSRLGGARFRQDFRLAWMDASADILTALPANADKDDHARVIAEHLWAEFLPIRKRILLYQALFARPAGTLAAEVEGEPGPNSTPELPSKGPDSPQVQEQTAPMPAVMVPAQVNNVATFVIRDPPADEREVDKARRFIACGEPDIGLLLYSRLFMFELREWAKASGQQELASDPNACIRAAVQSGVFPDAGMADLLRQKTWLWLLNPSTPEELQNLRKASLVFADHFDVHLAWLREATTRR